MEEEPGKANLRPIKKRYVPICTH